MRLAAAIAVALLLTPAPAVHASAPTSASESAEAICTTHGVLEAVCTVCNPKLAVVFKAKGDWCAEHGFPESFCPKCKPAQGGKPSADVSVDQAPANGLKVKLRTQETARLAGFETTIVAAHPARLSIPAVLRLSYDATRVAAVNARSPGVLRTLVADVGTTVKAGGTLAVIESAANTADRSRLDAARAHLIAAAAGRTRERSLSSQGVVAKKDLLAAEQEWATAKSEVDAAEATLNMAGSVGPGGHTQLESPIAGVITQRKVSAGQLVNTSDMLFEIVDTTTMWAELDIPETDIAQVRVGQVADISVDSLPDRPFSGRLIYLAPMVDPETRTIKGRVVLQNPDGQLRANMFGQARILVGEARTAIQVPRVAVQRVKDIPLVFVRRSETEYETRRVQLGQSDENTVDVLSGLTAGDQVVTTGSFLLKTETLKDSIGAGCCEADAKK